MLWFSKVISKHAPEFQRWWFGPYKIQYYLPNNIVLLITIDKFDPNPILVNIKKLKPYMFIEDKTLQPILANPSDLVADEFIQIKEPEPLLVEKEKFEFVKFEPVNNYLIHGNIIGIDVPIRYYDDVCVEFKYVLVRSDQNYAFRKKPINICVLKVYNPKIHIHS